jgi:prolyl-tRNA editing enzyme YbaK/EbsC (Cys-tRNA(Pro) deacylase)
VIDVTQPAIKRLVQAAALKGVVLDIRPLPSSASSPDLVAAAVHADIGQVVTATVFVADHRGAGLAPVVYLGSGRNLVDPCLLAALAGEVSLRAATPAEALDLTGHSPGRIPPFGFGRAVRTLMDGDLRRYQWVWAPAGSAAAVFHVGPRTLMALSSAVIVPVALPQWFADPNTRIERRHLSERRRPSLAVVGAAL